MSETNVSNQSDGWNLDQVETKNSNFYFADGSDALPAGQYDDKDSDYGDGDEHMLFGDMQLFFHAINEPQFIPNFLQQKVTLGQLLDFQEQDLINCGIELVGDRKKILQHIAKWHAVQWLPSSLHDLTDKNMLTAPGIYIAINDINKHLEYLDASFRFMRRQIEMKSNILELGKDYCGVRKIASELEDLDSTHKRVGCSINLLKKEIVKHVDDPLKLPPNHIDEKYIRKTKIGMRIIPWSISTLLVLTGFGVAVRYL